MITIEWYNIVAIVVILTIIITMHITTRNPKDIGDYVVGYFSIIIYLFTLILFIAIWGGIFWW